MSDELEPQGGSGKDEDEELLSGIEDIFLEEEDEDFDADSGVEEGDESLDELDAFLDDFEKNLDIPDADEGTAAAAEEVTADEAAPRGTAEDIGLDKSDLDLDVGVDSEMDEEEPAEESEPDAGEDDMLDLDAMLDEVELPAEEESERPEQAEMPLETAAVGAAAAAAATTAAASPAAASAPAAPLAAAAPAISRAAVAGGAVMLLLSVLLSLAALWIGMGLAGQIDVLNQNVSELQKRVLTQSRRGTIAPQAQMGDQLNRMAERINELAVIVEGPVSHLRESNQQALQELSSRVEALEKSAPQPQAASRSKPLVSKAKPVAQAPQATPAPKGGGGWVINLLSVTSAKTASEELARIRKMGIRADRQTVNQKGKTWYRLRVTGFDSYEGAKAYIETVERQTGFKSAWVARE